MRKAERGYTLAEMMVGLFAFSLILSSIVFLITRWQQTTSLTRIQRVLSTEAREAMRQIMEDLGGKKLVSNHVPEHHTHLRTLQFVIEYRKRVFDTLR